MGNDKVALVHPPGTELDDVQIQRPWSPVFGALPSFLLLYRLTCSEQATRIEPRLEEYHLIQIRGLLHAGEWQGFFDRRRGEQSRLWKRRQRLASSLEVPGAVAEIAA